MIGGFKPNAGGLETLVVGYYEGRRLICAGRVRAGLTPRVRADLFARVAPLIAPRCPFVNLPKQGTGHWGEGITAEDMKSLHWVRPRLVAEVSFVEWTRDGSLRHAAFVALRDDKRARDVVRDPTGQSDR